MRTFQVLVHVGQAKPYGLSKLTVLNTLLHAPHNCFPHLIQNVKLHPRLTFLEGQKSARNKFEGAGSNCINIPIQIQICPKAILSLHFIWVWMECRFLPTLNLCYQRLFSDSCIISLKSHIITCMFGHAISGMIQTSTICCAIFHIHVPCESLT